jgi:hypothetical protein
MTTDDGFPFDGGAYEIAGELPTLQHTSDRRRAMTPIDHAAAEANGDRADELIRRLGPAPLGRVVELRGPDGIDWRPATIVGIDGWTIELRFDPNPIAELRGGTVHVDAGSVALARCPDCQHDVDHSDADGSCLECDRAAETGVYAPCQRVPRACQTAGCRREPAEGYAHCAVDTARLLTGAFAATERGTPVAAESGSLAGRLLGLDSPAGAGADVDADRG